MKLTKSAVSIALICLFVADIALAVPELAKEAPQSSIDTCLAEVRANADFDSAGSVRYSVETEERPVSGHSMRIETLIYGENGEGLIREYAASCAINDRDQIRHFNIRRIGT